MNAKYSEIIERDWYLCQCCGFKGSEVHHITPKTYGGSDNEDNLILLCSECHKHAPNKKEEFEIYKKEGGRVTVFIWGKAILAAQRLVKDNPEIPISDAMNVIKKTLSVIKNIDFECLNPDKILLRDKVLNGDMK